MASYAPPMASASSPVGFENTTDPRKIAANQRGLVWGRGDVLNQQQIDQGNYAAGNAAAYQQPIDQIAAQYMAGQGGYTPEEAAGIRGDTSSYSKYFNPEQSMGNVVQDQNTQFGILNNQQGEQKGAVSGLQTGLRGAIDPSALQQKSTMGSEIGASVGAQKSELGGALDTESSGLKSAIDPNKLSLSSDFTNHYLMTPEEQQNIVSSAGISAGLKDAQAVGDTERAARAAGASPLGVGAYRARMATQQAADAGDAMTSARVAASNAAAARQQTNESMRLGSQQDISGRQMTAAETIGGQAASNINTVQEQGREADLATEQNRQAAQQYLTGAGLQAATTGGEAAIQNAQTATGQTTQALQNAENQRIQQGQFNTATGTNIAQAQDVANSNRAGTVANTRINQQNTGIGIQQQSQQQQNQNAQNAYNRQLGVYGTQTSGSGQATNAGVQASQTPSTLDKVIGGIGGAVGALGALDDGAVIDQPTVATLGEQGPEAVVPLNQPWWKRAGQAASGVAPAMSSAGKMASAGNPWGAAATAGAGLAGKFLANRMARNKANGAMRAGLATTPMDPGAPPPVSAPPSPTPYMQGEPMAQGKIVDRPTVALLGEKQPEAVIPLNGKKDARVRAGAVMGRRPYQTAA